MGTGKVEERLNEFARLAICLELFFQLLELLASSRFLPWESGSAEQQRAEQQDSHVSYSSRRDRVVRRKNQAFARTISKVPCLYVPPCSLTAAVSMIRLDLLAQGSSLMCGSPLK